MPEAHMPDQVHLVLFETAGRRLALPASAVQEIVRAAAISPLPRAPEIVEGVINVRGTVLPVVDIRARFGLPASTLSPDQYFILAHTRTRVVVLRVDQVVGLIQVGHDAVLPPETVAPGSRHIAGIARLSDGVVVIQDLDQFLSLDEATRLEAAIQEPGR
jgi:purine-binding chemotaxis protein CheW